MEKRRMVIVTNAVGHSVSISNRELNFRRKWDHKGDKKRIDYDVLEELLYNRGVETLFKEGYLVIDNLQDAQDLGLEPIEATEPTNIITLTDFQRNRLLTVAPLKEFMETLDKLSTVQAEELAQYAIDNKVGDLERYELLKKKTGLDVITVIKNLSN